MKIKTFNTENVDGSGAMLRGKQEVMDAVAFHGSIFLTRFDTDLCEVVTDLITADMPESEIIV